MGAAQELSTSFASEVRQTFLFDVENEERLQSNNQAARDLVSKLLDKGAQPSRSADQSKWLFHDVPKADVIDFVSSYHLDDAQHSMPKDLMLRYLEGRSDEAAQLWNVALMGSSKQSHRLPDGSGTHQVERFSFAEASL